MAQIAVLAVLGVALAISIATDLRSRKIKNVVTLPAIALCLAARLASGGWGEAMGWGLFGGLLGALAGGALFLLLAIPGGMGMGDVKLVAVVGAAVGFPTILPCLAFIGVAGGIQALVTLLWRREFGATLVRMARSVARRARLSPPLDAPEAPRLFIPYAFAIAAGTVWGVLWTLGQTGPAQ